MTKKKDHLYLVDDLVKSVLLGVPATSACGRQTAFTRERLEETGYFNGCKDCMAVAGKEAAVKDDVVRVHPKEGWQRLVERAWLLRYEEATRPRVQLVNWGSGSSYGYNFTVQSWKSPKGGDPDAS